MTNMTIKKTPKMREIEERLGRPLEEVILEVYERTGGSVSEIAKELGINPHTAYIWIYRLGLTLDRSLIKVW